MYSLVTALNYVQQNMFGTLYMVGGQRIESNLHIEILFSLPYITLTTHLVVQKNLGKLSSNVTFLFVYFLKLDTF